VVKKNTWSKINAWPRGRCRILVGSREDQLPASSSKFHSFVALFIFYIEAEIRHYNSFLFRSKTIAVLVTTPSGRPIGRSKKKLVMAVRIVDS